MYLNTAGNVYQSFIRIKKKAYVSGKQTGDRAAFQAARKTAKAPLRTYHQNNEQKLLYEKTCQLSSHVFSKIRGHQQYVNMEADSGIVSDKEATDIFNQEFYKNFSLYSRMHSH